MTNHICSCGSPIPQPFNSTIYPKLCPSCERIKKNKTLLSQSYQSGEKVSKKDYNKVKKKKTPIQRAMDRADEIFSRYIRVLFSIEFKGELFCKDVITDNLYPIKRVDNGHFFSRKFLLTRYEVDNCRPQNRSSNRFSGEADHYKFGDKLKAQIGEERFNRLDQLRRQKGDDTELFYKEQSAKYRKLFNQLLKEKGVKNPWAK